MISKEEVLNLAELARLQLSDEEVSSLQKDISNILAYVGQVSATSASGDVQEKPLLRNVLREDTPRLPAQAGAEGDALAGKEKKLKEAFPKREGDYNVVRKIIQKDE